MRGKIAARGALGRVGGGSVETVSPVGAGRDREKEPDRIRGKRPGDVARIRPVEAGNEVKDFPAGAEEAGVARHSARGPGVFVVDFAGGAAGNQPRFSGGVDEVLGSGFWVLG